MNVYNKLSDYATKNIWCAPGMDSQYIVRPDRLKRPGGYWNSVLVLDRSFPLPLQKTRFYVYQLSRLPVVLVGLLDNGEVWTKVSDTMRANSLIMDLYNQYGIQYARATTWYMVTKEKEVLLAVQHQPKIPINLDKEYLYLRFYTNRLNYPGNLSIYVDTDGKNTYTTQDILDIQDTMQMLRLKAGSVYGFVNGMYVPDITLTNTVPGDYIEYVYDSSIYRIVDLAVPDLPSFTSVKDACNKFLLNYPGNSLEIDYHDDIDVWLINDTQHGVYYHRNSQTPAVTMVTHKDYAIPVAYVQDYVNNLPLFGQNIKNVTVRLQIRKASNARSLVYENNRIHELYKLPPTRIKEALLGINSNVDNWQAAVLENSPYASIMAQTSSQIDSERVEQALGYNAISRTLFDTPSRTYTKSGQTVADLPYGLMNRSTGYEYDSTGKLLLSTQHLGGSVYIAGHAKAQWVEVLAGYATQLLDDTYGQQTSSIDPTLDYRFYTCDLVDGVAQNNWKDVTGTSVYAVVNGTCTWFTDPTKTYTLVRSNLSFLGYSVTLPAAASILQLTLTQSGYRNGQFVNFNMQVPLGELRLWLNDRELIEGLDYIVKFPKILIINKSYLNNPKILGQTIRVRFTGLATDMQRQSLGDVGFVKYGTLSRNNRFDIRDDKVLHINVDGYYYDRSELTFSEDHPELVAIDARNGAPYQLSDIVTPMRGLTHADTYTLRDASMVIDKKVSDYNSQYIQDDSSATPSVIDSMHMVYSPFCHKILMDLVSGALNDPRLKQQYGDDTIREICQPYTWLLDYDPTQDQNLPDLNYVVIHPHNLPSVVQTDAYGYKFLENIVRLYLKNRVVLSGFVSITL